MIIAVLGGSGKEGSGLAMRWAHAGHTVVIGSRDPEKAQRAADELNLALGSASVRGASNTSGTPPRATGSHPHLSGPFSVRIHSLSRGRLSKAAHNLEPQPARGFAVQRACNATLLMNQTT